METKKGVRVISPRVTTVALALTCIPYFLVLFGEFFYWHLDGPFRAENAHEAYMGAYSCTANMVRVAIESFCFIVGATIFGDEKVWDKFSNKFLGILHMLILLSYAYYAYLNLYGEYISLFGITPMRQFGMWLIYMVIVAALTGVGFFIKQTITKWIRPR